MTQIEAYIAGAWRGLSLPGDKLADVLARYNEPQRAYHNLTHVKAVLDMVVEHARPTQEVIAAALLHDVIYDTRATDNEKRSAAYTRGLLGPVGWGESSIRRVEELILFTKGHVAPVNDEDASSLLDADLAVLGGYEEDYDRYAAAIRLEYWHVEPEAYRKGRIKVLESFLARARIYRLADNFAMYEETARANIRRELFSLAG